MAGPRRGHLALLSLALATFPALTLTGTSSQSPGEASYLQATELLERCCGGSGDQIHLPPPTRGAGPAAQLADAVVAAGAAVELDGSNWQHHNLLGEAYLQQSNWELAAQSFLTVTQLDSQVASAFLKLGLSLSHMPGYEDKSAESRLIAARLNTDYADLDELTWQSNTPGRVRTVDRSVTVAAPPLGPPLAVLVPYRDRAKHLSVLIPALSKLLIRNSRKAKAIKYGIGGGSAAARPLAPRFRIFVLEQANEKQWNKGSLYNAGFDHIHSQTKRYGSPECFVFHDVDFIPQSKSGRKATTTAAASSIHYGCVKIPTHLSAAPSQYGSIVPYASFFGGVLEMSARDFIGMNGYSNRYWLWGKEDDDLFMRMIQSNVSGGMFARESVEVGAYECLDHERDYSNVGSNVELLIEQVTQEHDMWSEGLNNVKYTIVSETTRRIADAGGQDREGDGEGESGGKAKKRKKKKNKSKKAKAAAASAAAEGEPQHGADDGGAEELYPYTHIMIDF